MTKKKKTSKKRKKQIKSKEREAKRKQTPNGKEITRRDLLRWGSLAGLGLVLGGSVGGYILINSSSQRNQESLQQLQQEYITDLEELERAKDKLWKEFNNDKLYKTRTRYGSLIGFKPEDMINFGEDGRLYEPRFRTFLQAAEVGEWSIDFLYVTLGENEDFDRAFFQEMMEIGADTTEKLNKLLDFGSKGRIKVYPNYFIAPEEVQIKERDLLEQVINMGVLTQSELFGATNIIFSDYIDMGRPIVFFWPVNIEPNAPEIRKSRMLKEGRRFKDLVRGAYNTAFPGVLVEIQMKDKKFSPWMELETEHELGHLLGLPHDPKPNNSIMSPKFDTTISDPSTLTFTQEDKLLQYLLSDVYIKAQDNGNVTIRSNIKLSGEELEVIKKRTKEKVRYMLEQVGLGKEYSDKEIQIQLAQYPGDSDLVELMKTYEFGKRTYGETTLELKLDYGLVEPPQVHGRFMGNSYQN